MEKNGLIQLTRNEVKEFLKTKIVPDRVSHAWGVTSKDLESIIQSHSYNFID